MAVKFTFTLNDSEAENLFHWLQSEKNDMDRDILQEISGEKRQNYLEWYRKHKAYVDGVMKRILSEQKRLPDSEEFEIPLEEDQKIIENKACI